MKVHVRVTKTDIKKGIPESPTDCPIARALLRRHPQRFVEVSYNGEVALSESGFSWKKSDYLRTSLPLEARQFIENFDCGRDVQPFTFDLTFKPPKYLET